ncbi:MAG: cation:proton antiporter [Alphaproteobacteria bacterium]|nr:cation:proton antiporter [Alphaproteobacteria bacterium]
MAGHGPQKPIDLLQKLAIVAVLFVGIMLMYRYAPPSGGTLNTMLLAVGFVVLASYTIGEIAQVFKLPHITGYLVTGVVLGFSLAHTLLATFPSLKPWMLPPFDAGLLTEGLVGENGELKPLNTLALALICLTAGGELKIEALRRGLGRILAILGAQTVTIFVGVIAMFLMVSGRVPLMPVFEPLKGLDLSATIALGAVLASVSLATAPAATIAIINSTKAKGPMTDDVLPVVVLKDVIVVVAFSAASVIALGLMPGASGGTSFASAMIVIAGSVIFGALVGGLVHVYLRFVGAELLLFILGMVFATSQFATFATHRFDPSAHAELPLVFIAMGFIVSNFSSEGDHLIHEVERLSGPVYVLFFTMAGASLHIDVLLDPRFAIVAVILVATRVAMLYAGVTLGARAMGAHASTQSYGWMGFVSQAGLALTLGGTINATFGGEIGLGMYSLILAGAAINEVIGPILLQAGLTLAGETAEKRGEDEEEVDFVTEREQTEEALAPWRREDVDPDAWGPPPATGSDKLDTIVSDLELELRTLVRDLEAGPLPVLEKDALTYVRTLRRDFLRLHRHLATHHDSPPDELLATMRAEMAELAARWRDALLDRSTTITRRGWSPRKLQEALDRRVANLPEQVIAPANESTFLPRDEPLLRRVNRWTRRVRHRMAPQQRTIHVLALGRFHLQGRVAGRMEEVAALTVNAELHLANRTAALFDAIDHGVESMASQMRRDPAAAQALIAALREEIEDDFKLAIEEVGWITSDVVTRATKIIGGALKDLKHDLDVYDTPDLPPRLRRYRRVFDERTAGLNAITQGLEDARATASSRYSALALAFEVIRLEARVKEAVDTHGERLARQIRGKGLLHLERVRAGIETLLGRCEALLDPASTRSGAAIAVELEEATKPARRMAEEAIESATALRDWLAGEASDEPLLEAIVAAAQGLTEHYDVPTSLPVVGERALPSRVHTTEVPFREVALSFIEANITRDLVDVTRRLAVQVDGLVHALQDVERILSFNAELAQSELEVHGEALPAETRDLVREMAMGSWGRSLDRLKRAEEEANPWPSTAAAEVREAVIGKLDAFREQVLDGRISDLLHTLLREVRVRGQLFSSRSFTAVAEAAGRAATDALVRTLGDERIATIRHQLGLRDVIEVAQPHAFAPPTSLERLPAVYGRLFSENALEASDLLTGRDEEYAVALAALRPHGPGLHRSVALVGMDGIAKRALANALVRGLGHTRVDRFTPDRPVLESEVTSWFAREPGGVLVLDGLAHLMQSRPGGFAPLRRFLQGMVEDGGRTAFVVLAEPAAWDHARVSVGFGDLVACTVPLRHLTLPELETALLARHSMSGYRLHIQPSDDLAWQVADLLSRTEDTEQRHQRAWFRTLHEATDGVMQDALRLWMASILDVDESDGVIHLGEVPRPPIARIRRLPEESLLTLRASLIQGCTTVGMHASAFRVSESEARTELASLKHSGLLQEADGLFRIPDHLRASVYSVLHGRGWL